MEPQLKAVVAVVVCVAVTLIVRIIADASVRYAAAERGDGLADDQMRHIDGRLDRVQAAIDAVAIEMERVGERQRFTELAVAELRAAEPDVTHAPRLPGAHGRIVTPH
ncbi:MAG TPA: hypothetical protein VG916_02945 [Gemmatimonadaceae bacterium]|nr:hypothetical protein [Gemmatimonadaceae bacterium]